MRLLPALFCAAALAQTPANKPPLTLDDFFNSVDIPNVRVSPDGHAVAIETSRADWDANRFRSDLWLYRDGLIQLTQAGQDRNPEFSPDGRWIAFLSDRGAQEKAAQVYVISLNGGEPFPVTQAEEERLEVFRGGFAWRFRC